MKNSCSKVKPRLSEYVDGTLPGDVTWTVQLHIAACESCSLVVRQLEQTVKMMRSMALPSLPVTFDSELASRIVEIDSAKRKANTGNFYVRALYGFQSWAKSLTYRQRLRLAISTPVLAAVVAVMLGFLAPHATSNVNAASNDAAFAATCVQQHRTFVASQPLADPSAQALAQHIDSNPTAGEGVSALDVDGSL